MRTIALAAGCHIYSDAGDVVYASRNFIWVYAPQGGSRTFRLPRRSRVIDRLENGVITERVTDFPVKLAANKSVLLKLEDSQKK